MGLIIFGLALGSLIGLLSASRIISRKGTRFVALISVLIVIIGIFVISAGVFAAFKSIVFAGLIIFGLGYGLAEVALNVDGSALERAAEKTMMPGIARIVQRRHIARRRTLLSRYFIQGSRARSPAAHCQN